MSFLKRIFRFKKESKKEHRYYKDYRNIYDIETKSSYDTMSNTFSNLKPWAAIAITEDEYKQLLRNANCDCDLGDGHDIKRAKEPYSLVREYNNREMSKYFLEFSHSDYKYENLSIKIFEKNRYEFIGTFKISNEKFYKKACLNCGKCLDEINDLYKYVDDRVDEAIKEIEKEERQEQMIEDICRKG